jgi:hypothetical protein
MIWLALIVTGGAAVFWFVRAKQARAERDDARWALKRALRIEVRPGAKVYAVPRRGTPNRGGDAA